MNDADSNSHDYFASHPRDWRDNLYVYPVISRRSKGLSVGVNLNPDTACNFDCVYCQVDRTSPPKGLRVEPARLHAELEAMLARAADGSVFEEATFGAVPAALRRVNDIAFSGDGEPTTCPVFVEAVEIAAALKQRFALHDVKIVLITDACYLTVPEVMRGLRVMDENNGEIWAKLDAGTQAYYERINRPNVPLAHVMDNIVAAARERPLCIQSLFMRVAGTPPERQEIDAYLGRLADIVAAGGAVREVQVYTVARRPAVAEVTALTQNEVDEIVERVRSEVQLPATAYYAE